MNQQDDRVSDSVLQDYEKRGREMRADFDRLDAEIDQILARKSDDLDQLFSKLDQELFDDMEKELAKFDQCFDAYSRGFDSGGSSTITDDAKNSKKPSIS